MELIFKQNSKDFENSENDYKIVTEAQHYWSKCTQNAGIRSERTLHLLARFAEYYKRKVELFQVNSKYIFSEYLVK